MIADVKGTSKLYIFQHKDAEDSLNNLYKDFCTMLRELFFHVIYGSFTMISEEIQVFLCGFDALHPSQQFSSYVWTISFLPGLNQY